MNNPMDLPEAEAARLVRRLVPALDKDGKPTGEMAERPVKAAEVFAVTVRDEIVTVVTIDGQKLVGALPQKKGADK